MLAGRLCIWFWDYTNFIRFGFRPYIQSEKAVILKNVQAVLLLLQFVDSLRLTLTRWIKVEGYELI